MPYLLSAPNQLANRQSVMREDYLRIAVLAYMQQGGTVLLRQLLDIAVAYERGELSQNSLSRPQR